MIDVYPNPSSGLFDVEVISETQGNLKLTVLELLGRMVYKSISEIQGSTHFPVVLKELPNGQYILKIEAGGLVQIKRIVVTR